MGAVAMSVRKRKWTTGKGVEKEAWIVDYVDQGGKRRIKTFDKKREADAFSATTNMEVARERMSRTARQ